MATSHVRYGEAQNNSCLAASDPVPDTSFPAAPFSPARTASRKAFALDNLGALGVAGGQARVINLNYVCIALQL